MGMKAMSDLREMLCLEVEEIAKKGELSAGDLETAHKLTDTIKNIDKIEMLEGDNEYSQRYSNRGYSRDGGWEARGSYGRNGGYDNGNSYSRHYVRGHYSRDDGAEAIKEQLRSMMDDETLNQKQREAIRHAMEQMN